MTGYHLEREWGGRVGGSFEIGRPTSRGWKNFRHTGWGWGFEYLTIFMDVKCVSSLNLSVPNFYIMFINIRILV